MRRLCVGWNIAFLKQENDEVEEEMSEVINGLAGNEDSAEDIVFGTSPRQSARSLLFEMTNYFKIISLNQKQRQIVDLVHDWKKNSEINCLK